MEINGTSNLNSQYFKALKNMHNGATSKSFENEFQEETTKDTSQRGFRKENTNTYYDETVNKELERKGFLTKITNYTMVDTSESFNPYKTFDKPATMTTEEAIERSNKIQHFYQTEYEEFENAKLEYWANKDNPDYEPPEKYAKYLKQIKSVDPRDIIYDGKLVRLSLDESSWHHSLASTQGMELSEKARDYREWNYQFTIQTEQNKYEDAPEFEAFVKKWMDKGLSEQEALYRAASYASLGLLDYGNQRAVIIDQPYGDKKEHGFHNIDNEPLKQAVLEILDSLSQADVDMLKCNAFGNGQSGTSLNFDELPDLAFQDFLNNFASFHEKLAPLKDEYKDFTFDGNIDLTEDMAQIYKDFIVDNIKAYFEHRIQDVYNTEDENPDYEAIEKQAKLIQRIIDQFDKNIKEQEIDN